MSPRPPFISRLARIRNRALDVALRPFRWFSAETQLVIGFIALAILTTLLLARWPLTLRTVGVLAVVSASYFIVWRFVDYRTKVVDLFISKRRAFALVGSAILVETALIRLGFIVANGLAAQSTRAPLNDPVVWSFAIPFAAATLLVTMLLDRQLGLFTGVVASGFVVALAPNEIQATLYALISCSAAAYGIRQYRERQSVTLAGLVVAGVNCLTALALSLFPCGHRRWRRFTDDYLCVRRSADKRIVVWNSHRHAIAGVIKRRSAAIEPACFARTGNKSTFACRRTACRRCLPRDWRKYPAGTRWFALSRYWQGRRARSFCREPNGLQSTRPPTSNNQREDNHQSRHVRLKARQGDWFATACCGLHSPTSRHPYIAFLFAQSATAIH